MHLPDFILEDIRFKTAAQLVASWSDCALYSGICLEQPDVRACLHCHSAETKQLLKFLVQGAANGHPQDGDSGGHEGPEGHVL